MTVTVMGALGRLILPAERLLAGAGSPGATPFFRR